MLLFSHSLTMAVIWNFLFFLVSSVVQCQLTLPDDNHGHGNQGNNYCSTGFEMHGGSCYRFINMLASWTDAWTICQSIGSSIHPVSIETAEENAFLTDFVRRHTPSNTSTNGDLARRIWTDGNNFLGIHTWMESKTPFVYTSWHVGEPYLANPDEVFCVMKMGQFWYTDDCSHLRKFVCEFKIDGLVIPDPSMTQPPKGKPGDTIAVG